MIDELGWQAGVSLVERERDGRRELAGEGSFHQLVGTFGDNVWLRHLVQQLTFHGRPDRMRGRRCSFLSGVASTSEKSGPTEVNVPANDTTVWPSVSN
ncbi:MAG: hypothetical protein GKR86_03045 [Ilumatobacter sp.]|nr:hypothetical protein [Ilumatobacter sp.]